MIKERRKEGRRMAEREIITNRKKKKMHREITKGEEKEEER